MKPRGDYLLILIAALLVAGLTLSPYQSVPFERFDGTTVEVPNPEHVSHISDVWDYLQLGRQLERGEGFTTLFTYVPFTPVSEGTPFPLYWRQPVFPLLVAGTFVLGGSTSPNNFLGLQAVAIVLLGLGALRLGRVLLNRTWSLVAAIAIVTSPLILGVREPLVSTTLFAALLLWFCVLVLRANRPWHLALGGLCLGGLYLFRQETAILLPGLILLRFMTPTRGALWRELLLVAVFGFVAVFPWLYRSWDLTGDPLYNAASLLFHDTDAFPNWTSSRTQAILEMSSWEFVSNNWGDVLQKTAKNGFRFTRDLLLLPGIFLLPFFWLAIWPQRSETRFPLTAPFILMALTLLVVLSPLEYAPRFLAPIAPLAILVAASGLMRVAENKTQWLQVSPRVLGLLPVLIVGLALATYVGSLWQRSAEPQGTAAVALKDLDRGVAEDGMWPLLLGGVLLTDAPTLYAWVWDRPAIWAPVPEDVQATAKRYGRTGVILTCAAGQGDGLQADDLRQAYLSLVDQPPLDQCPTVLRVNR